MKKISSLPTLALAAMLFSTICCSPFKDQQKPDGYTDPSWEIVGQRGFSVNVAQFIEITISPTGVPYVNYYDTYYGGVIKKFDGNSWVNLNKPDIVWGRIEDIAFSPDGELYAWVSLGSIMQFDNTEWVHIGAQNFLKDRAGQVNITFNPSGELVIGFIDSHFGARATAMRYDGLDWICIGDPGFTGSAAELSVKYSPDGELFVAYSDSINDPYVMKYDGAEWNYVGAGPLAPGQVFWINLDFNLDGEPHLAFAGDFPLMTSVMKYDGSEWLYVGKKGISPPGVHRTCLKFSHAGEPCIAFMAHDPDDFNFRASVMRFNGNKWEYLGSPYFTPPINQFYDLDVGSNDQLYLAISDYSSGYYGKATVFRYIGN